MCEFQNGTYECRGDGYIWDADHEGYDPEDLSWACPNCNTEQYLLNAKDEAESTSSFSSGHSSGTGVTIWESAVAVAKKWNEDAANIALKSVSKVTALFDDKNCEDGAGEKVFCY